MLSDTKPVDYQNHYHSFSTHDIHHPPSDHRCSPWIRSYHGDRVFMRWLSLSEAGQHSEWGMTTWLTVTGGRSWIPWSRSDSWYRSETWPKPTNMRCDDQIDGQEILEINCKSRNLGMKLDLSVILIDQFPEPREWMFRNSRPSKWKIVHLWFWEGFI